MTSAVLTAAGLAFVVCCALWWIYFDLSAPAIEHGLEVARTHIDIIRPVLSYGYLGFIAGIVGVAAAIGAAVREPTSPLHADMAMLLFGGAAIYLGTFGFTRWRLLHTLAVPRLAAAGCCLVLAIMAPPLPAAWSLVLLSLVLVGASAADSWQAKRATTVPHV
ncbi:low temperature requirement protein A [Arsenicicoccus piscis]|uniref:Low temperature requirement protein A n=1 Tax=Arsenicicoccus piscis TaxID=673954 RepID=A0ABQ6HUG9_9MICO|nr:low temperature requirement protein A [Arsenicicoccus piscis]MCH8626673.1 low temperature requirement protein A [Arsenicicoccus piscis]GMA21338.1 hypothetical protein GCM10025862_33590 [Arsenicicoccus piscis]